MSDVEIKGQALDRGFVRWWGYGLCVIGGIAGLAAVFDRDELLSTVVLLIPLAVAALLATAPEAFEVTSRRSGGRSVNFVLMISLLGLFFTALSAPVLDYGWGLAPAVIGAAVGGVAGVMAAMRPGLASPATLVGFMVVYGAAYGFGGAVFADMRFDASAGQVFQTHVEDRREQAGGRGGRSYHLVLGPWGPAAHGVDARVSKSLYDAVGDGDTVCVTLHPGALGLNWYKVGLCR